MNKQFVVYPHNDILFSNKNNVPVHTFNKMDASQNHYDKVKETVHKRLNTI